MSRETDLERRFVQWCRGQGLRCEKLAAIGRRGWPDRTVIGKGLIAFVELKRPGGGKRSPHQIKEIESLKAMGFSAGFADSLEDAIAIVERARNANSRDTDRLKGFRDT